MQQAQRLKAAEALGELLDSKAPAIRLAAARTVREITAKATPTTGNDARFTAIMTLLQGAPTP